MKIRNLSGIGLILLPGIVAFAIYSTTTCRSIWIGDSAEFALALSSFGIAHPPGYPLFVLLGRLAVVAGFFLRPIFAAGLFNALAAAAVSSVTYVILRSKHTAVVALPLSLVFAFSPMLWAETAGVEVYALNLLMISLVILCLQSSIDSKWPMAAYLFGLSLTVHPTALALLPIIVYRFVAEREYERYRIIPALAALTLLGGTPYLYMLIRSHHHPISNWGDPETVTALMNHMTLKQYSGWVHNSLDNVLHSARLFAVTIAESWSWAGGLLVVAGAVIGVVVNRRAAISAILLLLGVVLLAASHQALDFRPFYVPAMFGAFLLAGNCFLPFARIGSKAAVGVRVAAATIAALVLLTMNYSAQNKSDYTLAEDYGRLLLDEAAPGILLTAGDINSFPALYLRYAENYRRNIEVYDRSIRFSALSDTAAALSGKRPTDYIDARNRVLQFASGEKYLAKIHYADEPEWLDVSVPLVSRGMLYVAGYGDGRRVRMPDYSAVGDPGDPLSRQLLANVDLSDGEEALLRKPPDTALALSSFNRAISRFDNEQQAMSLNEIGIFFRKIGFGEFALKAYDEALKKPLLSRSQRVNVEFNLSNIFKNMGNESLRRGDFLDAVERFKTALVYDSRNPKLLLNIGLIYYQGLGIADSARFYLSRYLDFNSSDSVAADMLRSIGP